MGADPPRGERLARWGAPALVAAVAFLPFARGLLSGASFYFRDLSRQFFPFRRFAAEGLRQGELRYWNPLVHEGEPLSILPVSYPVDLLHVLLPTEWVFSFVLALHVPLAALFFFALLRELGLARPAAAGGAAMYALGGFTLSCLNLYLHMQAVAWAPLVVYGFLRTARGRWRDVAVAALALATALTTSGVEVVAQTVVIGLVLAWPGKSGRRWVRVGSVVALGAGLAAYTLVPLSALVATSARGGGLPTEVVLSHAIHPLAFLQVLVAGFFGDPTHVASRFWGQRFFPLGFPYLVSLYLGASVLVLAALGCFEGHVLRRRLLFFAALGVLVSLGAWAGLGPLIDWLEPLRRFRYPSKAFFTFHFAVALLAALGLDAVHKGDPRTLRRLAGFAVLLGVPLVMAPLLRRLLPGAMRWFAAGFFPPDMPWGLRMDRLGFMVTDAALGGALALVLAGVAYAAWSRHLTAPAAAVVMGVLVTTDLLRAGAGLNAMVTPSFYSISPDTKALGRSIQEKGGRVFTCDVSQSRAYLAGREALGERQEVWSFALLRETLTPFFNLPHYVPTALSLDMTMLTSSTRVASPDEASCRDLASLLPRLREAGVAYVLSLDSLENPDLRLEATVTPAAVRPLAIHAYTLRDPRPAVEIAGGTARVTREGCGSLEVEVEATAGGTLVVRQSTARGWRAWIDGREEPLAVDPEGHLAVGVGPGRSRVRFDYEPPGLRAGVFVSALSLVVFVLAWRRKDAVRG